MQYAGYTLTNPPSPMNASDISPAVTRPIAEPLKGAGTFANVMLTVAGSIILFF